MNHLMMSLEGIRAKVGDEVIIYSNRPGDANSIDTIYAEHGLDNYNDSPSSMWRCGGFW